MLYNTITTVPNVFFLKKPCKFQNYSLNLQSKQRSGGQVIDLLQDLASFLCITPNYLSTIRKSITFESKK